MFLFADVAIYAPCVRKILNAEIMLAYLMAAIVYGGQSNTENSEFKRFVYFWVYHD